MTELSLIFARARNHCIGSAGDLPWSLPDDYRFFEDTTRGGTVIMGRRTYEDHHSLFPDRTNIVITSNPDYAPVEGVITAPDLAHARSLADRAPVFVIGGAGLFAMAFQEANRVFETVVDADIDGDTFLPEFDFSDFTTTLIAEHPADGQHAFSFSTYLHERH